MMYKFKVVGYDDNDNDMIIDQAHKIYIKLCYDDDTKRIMIVSNLFYKMSNIEIVDENGRSVSAYKKKTIINDILID